MNTVSRDKDPDRADKVTVSHQINIKEDSCTANEATLKDKSFVLINFMSSMTSEEESDGLSDFGGNEADSTDG